MSQSTNEKPDLTHIRQYVENNPQSKNTELFSILALLNAYAPDSYLTTEQCQQILGPPDPIDGGPPFTERMEPFTSLISTCNPLKIKLNSLDVADRSVMLLAELNIRRSATAKKCMTLLCGKPIQSDIIKLFKDLLIKREKNTNGQKDHFSWLIHDIKENENFYAAFDVLKTATDKFKQNPFFPQALSRLHYIVRSHTSYKEAEKWAKIAINRAKKNSYVADTLGQVYKNHLRHISRKHLMSLRRNITHLAEKALKAFKEVEEKAEKELDPEREDADGFESVSNSFNNRGHFGLIQVAKIIFLKQRSDSYRRLKQEVQAKFDFFEWYLSYSRPDRETLEPEYFWKDIVLCYNMYTSKTARDSTTFPGLLDRLNHGLFASKEKRAGFEVTEKTESDLTTIRDVLRNDFEENAGDANKAERYILSNIMLSNRTTSSPDDTLVRELKAILYSFLHTEVGPRSPEFYLLALLLYWPEPQLQMVQETDAEKLKQPTTEENSPQERVDNFVEVQGPDLQRCAAFMEEAFESKYAKYLRGRYLLPLFFLGKASGLCKWIHRSRLDKIVEEKVNAEEGNNLASDFSSFLEEKMKLIDKMWISGRVWQLPQIRAILLPVQIEWGEEEAYVCAGGKKIKTSIEGASDSAQSSVFYLGFNIQGPVVFKVGSSDSQ